MEKTITLRFTNDDLDKIRKGAKADERTISSFLRKCGLDRAKELESQ